MNIFLLMVTYNYSAGEVIAFYLIAAAFVLGVIYIVISSAARSDKILKAVRKQTNGLRRTYKSDNDNNDELKS